MGLKALHLSIFARLTFEVDRQAKVHLDQTEPMNAARSVGPDACDRCGTQKATKHLEFAFSGPWNVCVDCRQKLIAFHGGKPKRDLERDALVPLL